MKKRIIPATRILEFTFTDLPMYQFDTTAASQPNRDHAELHGWLQRLGDTAASAKTEAERREAVVALGEHYLSGATDWNMRTSGKARNPVWLAIAEKRGVEYDVIAAEMAQRDLDALAAL